MSKRHKIGDYELCDPDFRLVCYLSGVSDVSLEDVMYSLFTPWQSYPATEKYQVKTTLKEGQFLSICIDHGFGSLEFSASGIRELPPIQGLVVTELEIHSERPWELRMDTFPLLEKLVAEGELQELKFKGDSNLRELHINTWSWDTGLNLERVESLEKLSWVNSSLTRLDLSLFPNLKVLDCSENELEGLNLTFVPRLEELVCSHNSLKSLDLSGVPNLRELHCMSNNISELDLSLSPDLTKLDCSWNQIEELDLRWQKQLEDLVAVHNPRLDPELIVMRELPKNLSIDGQESDLKLT